jgi:hypothetical protein
MAVPIAPNPGGETALVRKRVASSSSPKVAGRLKYIVVISRTRLDLYAEMSRDFHGDPSIKVVLDRRTMERGRRVPRRQLPDDRRRRDRRVAEEQHRELARFGYVLVRATTT